MSCCRLIRLRTPWRDLAPPSSNFEDGIPCETDDAGASWATAWVRLSCPDIASEESAWSEAAKRLTEDQQIILIDPPIIVDEDGEWLPDTAISGDPEQRALVSCWVPTT